MFKELKYYIVILLLIDFIRCMFNQKPKSLAGDTIFSYKIGIVFQPHRRSSWRCITYLTWSMCIFLVSVREKVLLESWNGEYKGHGKNIVLIKWNCTIPDGHNYKMNIRSSKIFMTRSRATKYSNVKWTITSWKIQEFKNILIVETCNSYGIFKTNSSILGCIEEAWTLVS